MKLKRMADDLEKFHSSDALTLEDVLGILQNVSRDIKKETDQSVEECTVRDADALTGLLIWMGKLYQRIYASHETELGTARRLKEYQELAAKLEAQTSEEEAGLSQLEALTERVKTLQSEKEETGLCIAKMKRLQEQERTLAGELEVLRTEASDLPALEENIRKEQEELDQLKQKVSGRHDQLNGLWVQKAPLKEEVQRLQQTAETCRTQITELAAKKKELTEQKTVQEKQLAEINDDTMRLEMELKQQSGAVDLNTACRDKLQEKADDLRREQEKLDKKVEELREESNALQEHNTKALAEISFLERSIPTLRAVLGEAASQKENLTAQKEELDARLEEMEGKIHELSHAVELLEQTELPARAKKKSDVELKLHELKDENNKLQNDIRNCEMAIDDRKRKKDELEQRKKKLEDEQHQVTERLNETYGQINDMGENISHLQEQIHELEQQLEGKSQKGLALNLKARIAEYQNRKIECERLEQTLEAQQSQLNAKNTEIAQKKEEQEVLQLRFSQAENELESYQHSIAELTQRKDELADLEQHLKILKDVHQALQRHAKRLSELSPIGNYSDTENLGNLMDTMKDIIENIHKTMEQYIRKTNQSLEGIK